jgi:NADP-dependent 3-hydroxy acid dehydrogenase YdfG
MEQTILITGASSGIGKATAQLFADRGWNVIATMRSPEKEQDLTNNPQVLVTRLDVLDPSSIDQAIAAGLERFGRIDAVVNNAGYGAYGPLEAFDREGIIRQFNTNVIGLLDVTRAILPHFRAQGSGVLVNISSIGGRMTFPLGALYHGTKFAVEGISEALTHELKAIGTKMKIIEPGIVATDFGGRSFDLRNDERLTEYQPVVAAMMKGFQRLGPNASQPGLIAEVIHGAVTDGSDQLRYAAGADAEQLLEMRARMDDRSFMEMMKG